MGFFYSQRERPKDVATTTPRQGRSGRQLALLTSSTASLTCDNCTLNNARLEHPKMAPTGATKPLVYMLGEAPGEDEDVEGEQFVGKAGWTLRSWIPEGWGAYIRWNYTLRCRPTDGKDNNREPTPLEVACCRRLQEEDIARTKPKAVFGFGNVPLEWMIGERGIQQWRGRRIPCKVRGHSFWFYPMLHPSYINRIRNDKKKGKGGEWESVFVRDLLRAFDAVEVDKELPYVEDVPKELLTGVVPLLSWKLADVYTAFDEMRGLPDIGVDIETKGLRPQGPGAKILSIAFGTYEKTYALPLRHRQSKWSPKQLKELDEELTKFLLQSRRKWCQNTKFEQEWLSELYGDKLLFETQWGDTMAQAHVLDEREGKALGDLTLLCFGFDLKKQHMVDVANLDNVPLPDVLNYNATDAKYTQAIALLQQARLEEEGLAAVYEMTNRRCVTMVRTQRRGIHPDHAEVARWRKKLEAQIAETTEKIQSLPDIVAWGKAEGRKFNPASNRDVPSLFRDYLQIESTQTAKGGYSTDESALETFTHPIAKLLLTLRGDAKLLSTYVLPYEPSGKCVFPDGLVYGNFNHLITSTGRLASSDPNLQNWPKRKHKEIRNIFYAPDGHWIVAFDYGQIEARVIGMASKDRNLCRQLWTEFDIHAHWTQRIFDEHPAWRKHLVKEFGLTGKDEAKLFKTGRNETKNNFVFAQFYGSRYEGAAAMLNLPVDVMEGLSAEFWRDYAGVRTWQTVLHRTYAEDGYVATLTNRRRRAPLTVNERVNSPIQGTASDIVVDAMERLAVIAYEQERPQLQPILNVHDDLTFRLPDKTLEQDVATIACEMVMCRYSFINVPVVVEMSVGKAWGTMEEVQIFRSTEYDEWNKLFGHHQKTFNH